MVPPATPHATLHNCAQKEITSQSWMGWDEVRSHGTRSPSQNIQAQASLRLEPWWLAMSPSNATFSNANPSSTDLLEAWYESHHRRWISVRLQRQKFYTIRAWLVLCFFSWGRYVDVSLVIFRRYLGGCGGDPVRRGNTISIR